MRIAYIPHYQGPVLLRSRPCLNNLSLGSRAKVELIAKLLRSSSHDIEIISHGEVDVMDPRARFRFYPALAETELFDAAIPVYYSSAWQVRYLTGLWSAHSTTQLFKKRHRESAFDLVVIQTLKPAQLACASYAMRRLGLPVILQYEDDTFVNVVGEEPRGLIAKYHRYRFRKALAELSGCMAVSPYLLSQVPPGVPKLLLPGVVNDHIVNDGNTAKPRRNWVVFSGTHEGAQGLEQMVKAWQMLQLEGWELHIAGTGPLTPALQKLAASNRSIMFHGFLNSEANARLLCSAKIGMNPQDVTRTPGTSFAFKIIEYLAAGLHVITTPRGAVERDLEVGVSYIDDNTPEKIANCLAGTISERRYERTARRAALEAYSPAAVSKGLNHLIQQVTARS